MYKEKISFLGVEIQRGESKCLEFDVAKLHTRNSIKVPIFIERAEKDGPILLLLGGVHGDEINGVEIVRRIISNFEKLKVSEIACVESDFTVIEETRELLSIVVVDLDDLSQIQMREGRMQMAISQRAIDVVELFTQIEIYLLIFLAIAIQLVIIYQPAKKES